LYVSAGADIYLSFHAAPITFKACRLHQPIVQAPEKVRMVNVRAGPRAPGLVLRCRPVTVRGVEKKRALVARAQDENPFVKFGSQLVQVAACTIVRAREILIWFGTVLWSLMHQLVLHQRAR
jgi:hypothetical protein